jgi:hypothetical protein
MTLKGQIQLLSFCAFELCVGIFWPSMMSMRANYVPEELRATIINIFRIPLNAFVCIVLGNVSPGWLFGPGPYGPPHAWFSNCVLKPQCNDCENPKFSQCKNPGRAWPARVPVVALGLI